MFSLYRIKLNQTECSENTKLKYVFLNCALCFCTSFHEIHELKSNGKICKTEKYETFKFNVKLVERFSLTADMCFHKF